MENVPNIASQTRSEHRKYSFGQFILDVDRGYLLWEGKDIPLRPKCYQVLVYLVEHPGVLISKDEFLSAIWADVVVTEDSLTQCIIQIRKALGDRSKVMVRTVPRRGYLFDIPVEEHKPSVEPAAPATRQPVLPNRRPSRWSVGMAVVLATAIIATWWSSQPLETGRPTNDKAISPTSIAVLPFEDISPEGDQAYFADGLSEEVLNLLAQIPELQVIARTSSFSFRDQRPDIQTIGQKLNVANILEGSVRKDGDRIRITAQLVNASNSIHLWSRTYDRTLNNVFAVQSEIAASVAGSLKAKILAEPGKYVSTGHNPVAWEKYLKGRFFYSRRGVGDIERAVEHFRQALAIDPGFADAWVALAGSIYLQAGQEKIPSDEVWNKAWSMLDKALTLDPNNAEAHIRLAGNYRRTGEKDKYQQHLDYALKAGQSSALVQSVASGFAMRDGNMEEAIRLQRRAAALDPLGYVNNSNLGSYLYFAGYFDEARDVWLTAAALSPEHIDELNWLTGLSWIMQAQYVEAKTVLQSLPPGTQKDQAMALVHSAQGGHAEFDAATKRLSAGTDIDSAFYLTEIYSFRGDLDKSFQWLAETTNRILEFDPVQMDMRNLYRLRQCPFLAPMRGDPRWAEWSVDTEQIITRNRGERTLTFGHL